MIVRQTRFIRSPFIHLSSTPDTTAASTRTKDHPMLPIIIHLLEALRRALNKSGRGLSLIADAFQEAMQDWRKAHRRYPFSE